jgi:tight adherence protein B
MPSQTLLVFLFGAAAAGGLLWVFLYPILSGERQAEKRKASVAGSERATRAAGPRAGGKSRREQVEESLKELELRKKRSRNPPLPMRLLQAGLSWSPRRFYLISAVLALCAMGGVFFAGGGLLASGVLGLVAGLGLPRWILGFLKKRREKQFLNLFPDAVDVIVRGVKAGLPLGDCLKIIASETQEPVKSEFGSIVETQTIGIPMGEACLKLYESVPLPEANFFGIVVSIQQKAGGNLSEALGNLSRVLRDRKRMHAKIRAMSMEAKASAAIIGALPPVVMVLVYITSPNYIELLWTTPVGRVMLVACATWMTMGVFVMKKMINFDF